MNTENCIFDNLNLLRSQMTVPSFIKLTLIITLFSCKLYAQKYSEVQLGKIRYANKVLNEGIKKKDSLQIAEAYYLLGKVEFNASDILASQVYFHKSLRIQERYGDSYKLGRLYMWLFGNEGHQGHDKVAVMYLRKALSIFQRIKSDAGLAHAYSGFGALYSTFDLNSKTIQPVTDIKPNYDSALYYYNKSLMYSKRLKDTLGIAHIKRSIGNLMVGKKKIEGITYLNEALRIFSEKEKINDKAAAMTALAKGYLTFNQHHKAFSLIIQLQQMYDKYLLNEYYTKERLTSLYYQYYTATKNWEKAFIYIKLMHEYEVNRLTADNNGAVSRLNIEFETQKKEALLKEQKNKLDLQEENARIQRQFLITLALLLVITIALSFVFFRLYRKNQRISKRNEVLVNEQNHRVKNNLQVVSSLLHLQSKRLNDVIARQAVEESMLRIETMAILHRKLYDQDELAMVNVTDYIMDLVDEVLKTFDCASIEPIFELVKVKLSADQAMALGLIITELITNACKYAFPVTEQPTLYITSYFEKENLILIVKDNGPGFEPRLVIAKVRTFGLRLIQIQTAQLYGSYTFESKNGSTFTMKFKPLVP